MTDASQVPRDYTEQARAALDLPGPWPTTKKKRTGAFRPLDVDRFAGVAQVLSATRGGGDEFLVEEHLFREEEGEWLPWGGGGCGGEEDPFTQRADRRWMQEVFSLESHGASWRDGAERVHRAVLLCAPLVATVIIDRSGDIRTADVALGPGWIGIHWPERIRPTVRAFDFGGSEVGRLGPTELTPPEYPYPLRRLGPDG